MRHLTKIVSVVGARPNFMKIAPIIEQLKIKNKNLKAELKHVLVHTGQHYDEEMSKSFFEDLNLPKPDINLGVGSASHAVQTAKIMIEFEKVCLRERPDLIIVVGDVNSTIACALVASKLGIKIAHIEAGLRSFDRAMPEEINRVLTDAISDYLFTTCEDANENLRKEGIPEEKIYFVGNVMIDTLLRYKERAKKSKILEKLGLNKDLQVRSYALLTLHRPSNVDNRETFINILKALKNVSKKIPIIFPAHPRTQRQIKSFGLEKYFNFVNIESNSCVNIENSINLLDPLSYLDFLNLMANAKFVLTDSGGIQEETTILNIPCLTLRENTERPVTLKEGTNTIVGSNPEKIISKSMDILNGKKKIGRIPKLWDGKAAERIINILIEKL
ncbi:UDP-N-acetylglucosamine 2-epimerase [Candidatus Desulfofervidus auxilii]|uniref:UDP-N-acetylglucosamine 2-epimerase n=1 Tax=Desulfofervidus auxilii TaxID=1621989 RepID=A0A7U4TIL2_DESA2|nr:UDP-N-acetylglucosamine 2-epimerase (non-hydrolyzing) [Candidatus Desulfofervidus auxilii]AMM41440.1 UDP-N-acetylglucosamine 2-epimerase [Candidatus Desulfofervidus auxilii]